MSLCKQKQCLQLYSSLVLKAVQRMENTYVPIWSPLRLIRVFLLTSTSWPVPSLSAVHSLRKNSPTLEESVLYGDTFHITHPLRTLLIICVTYITSIKTPQCISLSRNRIMSTYNMLQEKHDGRNWYNKILTSDGPTLRF